MTKQSKKKKLLLGSALAGLMVAGPGIAVTTSGQTNGSLFQTAEFSVGYRLADAAGEHPEVKEKAAEKHEEGKEKKEMKKAAEHKCGENKCGEGKCGEKKAKESGDKLKKEAKCGEGKCG